MTLESDNLPEDDLRGLLAALREDTLTVAQAGRLETLLRESDEALSAYIRMVALQADLCGSLVGWAIADPVKGPDGAADASKVAPVLMPTVSPEPMAAFQETLYGQAVFEEALRPQDDDENEPLTVPPWSPPTADASRRGSGFDARRWRFAGLAMLTAAMVIIGFALWPRVGTQGPTPPVVFAAGKLAVQAVPNLPAVAASTLPTIQTPAPIVATLTASVDAVWQKSNALSLDAPLRAGSRVDLTDGYARLTFSNGVEVVVDAPAELTIESASRMLMERGRLTAKVPEQARGFAIATKLVDVIDLGTEFGVNLAPDGSVEVPVFTGRIEAHAKNGTEVQPVGVDAGKTGRVNESGVKVRPAGPEAAKYVRDITQIRAALPVRGTGQDLKEGDPDPNWLITAAGYDPNWKPRVVAVCGPGPRGLANDLQSGWISTTGTRPPMRGGRYTFETTFDLSRFEPATAQLHLRLGVDDFIREVRLNGRPTDIILARPAGEAKLRLYDFDIKEGFVPGTNRLEVVVENGHGAGAKEELNPMALRVELAGSAVRKLDGR
jgi:hypothetical protein